MTIGCDLICLEEITEFLDRFFGVECFPDAERGGIYSPSSRLVKSLGLALEPWTQLQEWAIAQNLDALFLHRPWQLQAGQLSPDIGIISYHLPFDEGLTIGFNPRLAQVLNMSSLEVLGEKENRAIGMLGEIAPQNWESFFSCINRVFDGHEQVRTAVCMEVKRVAVVGAMTDSLVREAAVRGADVYITGQLRKPSEQAINETQIAAIAVGHRRSEEWGLKALAGVLRERWFNLEVILP